MNFDKASCGLALKVVSCVSTGLFAGGSMYISLVEAPARATHDAASAVTMWKPSFIRAQQLQRSIDIVAFSSAFGVYACIRNESKDALIWACAGATMFSIFPFTLIFILPVNNQLMETEKCISEKGNDWIVENLNHWRKLNSVRTLLSIGAFGAIVYCLVK